MPLSNQKVFFGSSCDDAVKISQREQDLSQKRGVESKHADKEKMIMDDMVCEHCAAGVEKGLHVIDGITTEVDLIKNGLLRCGGARLKY